MIEHPDCPRQRDNERTTRTMVPIRHRREAMDLRPRRLRVPHRHGRRTTNHDQRSRPAVRRVTTLAVLAVALVAAVASYDHQRELAELASEGWRAWLLPVSVDGLVVAASMSMLVRRRAGLPAGALAWASLLAGIGASLAANVAAADPTAVGRIVAAWPPVALLLAWELLMQVRAPAAERL
jgi:hypothetical protein